MQDIEEKLRNNILSKYLFKVSFSTISLKGAIQTII